MAKISHKEKIEKEAIASFHRKLSKIAQMQSFRSRPVHIVRNDVYYFRADYADVQNNYIEYLLDKFDKIYIQLCRYFPRAVVADTRDVICSGLLNPCDIIPFMICACGYDDITRADLLFNL